MRYLTLAADYSAVAIRDEQLGPVALADLGLPKDLVAEIVAWNDRYRQIIPAGLAERRNEPMASLIRELDDTGLRLAERMAEVIGESAKVRYYSEGLLREVT